MQVKNLELKKSLGTSQVKERKKKLVKTNEAIEVIYKVLKPLRASLDQLRTILDIALNPSDQQAASILETEINKLYADLTKSLSQAGG